MLYTHILQGFQDWKIVNQDSWREDDEVEPLPLLIFHISEEFEVWNVVQICRLLFGIRESSRHSVFNHLGVHPMKVTVLWFHWHALPLQLEVQVLKWNHKTGANCFLNFTQFLSGMSYVLVAGRGAFYMSCMCCRASLVLCELALFPPLSSPRSSKAGYHGYPHVCQEFTEHAGLLWLPWAYLVFQELPVLQGKGIISPCKHITITIITAK